MRTVRRTGAGAWKWRLDLSEESSDAGDDVILVSLCVKGCNRDDNLETTLEYAIGGFELLERVVSLLLCLSLELVVSLLLIWDVNAAPYDVELKVSFNIDQKKKLYESLTLCSFNPYKHYKVKRVLVTNLD